MTVSDPISKQILWLALNSSRVFYTKFCPRDTCLQEMIFALVSRFSMIPLGIEFFIFTIRNSFSFLSKHLHHRGNSVPLQLEGRRALEHTILFVLWAICGPIFLFSLVARHSQWLDWLLSNMETSVFQIHHEFSLHAESR